MKKAHYILVASTLLLAGCGDHFNGTYTGTSSYQVIGQGVGMGNSAQPQSGSVTITISDAGDQKQVNWVDQFGGSGQGKGTPNGNAITGLTMTMTDPAGFGGSYQQYGTQGQSTNYLMTMSVDDNDQLTASGVSSGTNPVAGQQQMPMVQSSATRSATAKKQN